MKRTTSTAFKKGNRVRLVATGRQMVRDVGIPIPVALNEKGRVIDIHPSIRTSVLVHFRKHPDELHFCCPEWLAVR